MQTAARPSDRQVALLISVAVGVVVAIITTATFYWIYELASGPERRAAVVAAAAPYDPSSGIRVITTAEPNIPTDGREPWLGLQAWTDGVQAGQTWVQQRPTTLNAQVLIGMNSAQVWGYMQQYVSGALGVSCQYCHNITNFSSDEFPQKVAARNMMRLTNELNKQFITNLPNWKGNYVQCATCHQGKPVEMTAVSAAFIKSIPPINVVVDPLDAEGKPITDPAQKPAEIQQPLPWEEAVMYYLYNYSIWNPFDPAVTGSGRGALSLTHENGRTQDQVNINQNVMNYNAWSLGVNCLYCHNSRNFVAYETNTAGTQTNAEYGFNKLKAQQMLLMTTWIGANWDKYGAIPVTDAKIIEAVGPHGAIVDGLYYRNINGQVYNMPACNTCHAGNFIPKPAINQSQIPAGDAGVVILPLPLRGQ